MKARKYCAPPKYQILPAQESDALASTLAESGGGNGVLRAAALRTGDDLQVNGAAV